MILNIVNKNSRSSSALQECLAQISRNDCILLIEDGIYSAVDTALNRDWLAQCPTGVAVYALTDDLLARGLSDHILSAIKPVDYAGFVELVAHYKLSQSWF
jgi:tRNA 2-thiouridine synthesizing protein B